MHPFFINTFDKDLKALCVCVCPASMSYILQGVTEKQIPSRFNQGVLS